MSRQRLTLFDSALIGPAIADSFKKLDPRVQLRSPVMFVVYVGSLLTTILWLQALRGSGDRRVPACERAVVKALDGGYGATL